MGAVGIQDYGQTGPTFKFASATVLTARQFVKFGANDFTITGTLSADDTDTIGIALYALSAADLAAGVEAEVEVFGKIRYLTAGGTCTRGKYAQVGIAGLVDDASASPPQGTFVCKFLKSGVAGDLIPCLMVGG